MFVYTNLRIERHAPGSSWPAASENHSNIKIYMYPKHIFSTAAAKHRWRDIKAWCQFRFHFKVGLAATCDTWPLVNSSQLQSIMGVTFHVSRLTIFNIAGH